MDHFDLKPWRTQNHQSEGHPHGSASSSSSSSPKTCSALPLFVTEPSVRVSNNNLSAFPSVFSVAQRQELELQALIFKYMLAGAPVPVELLQSIKSLVVSNALPSSYLYSHPYHQQQYHQHYQPYALDLFVYALFSPYFAVYVKPGYWSRNVVDPEPGRCRRTDGKKWRCSRDVVAGQKYCERHVHRGRNRSRKPVEIATPAALKTAVDSVSALPLAAVASSTTGGAKFAPSKPSSLIDFQLNQRSSEVKMGSEISLEAHNVEVGRSEGQQLLRHFFDERPKSQVESNSIFHNADPTSVTTTGLSIAIPRSLSSGDFSLKLSTGNADHAASSGEMTVRTDQSHQSWGREWGSQQGSSMAGLLGEMLRSSSSDSPTSVLHELRRGCVSETSSIST
ncbi:hypothetical protein Scep_015308 [Stephania cephalantha]|uniref:Growth-regulating factor n=1 Tax=Stephania cephalantha TaxID=152367 RepID=A0AAP0J2M2_9MAGN